MKTGPYIGASVPGGTADRILFLDRSGRLVDAPELRFDSILKDLRLWAVKPTLSNLLFTAPSNTPAISYRGGNPYGFVYEYDYNGVNYFVSPLRVKNNAYGTQLELSFGSVTSLEMVGAGSRIQLLTNYQPIIVLSSEGIDGGASAVCRVFNGLQTNTTAGLEIRQPLSQSGDFFQCNDSTGTVKRFFINKDAKMCMDATHTAAGVTGNQTINKAAGSVNIAAGEAEITVNNSLVTQDSIVIAVVATNDTTAQIKNVVTSNGSFTIRLAATPTAETRIKFMVVN